MGTRTPGRMTSFPALSGKEHMRARKKLLSTELGVGGMGEGSQKVQISSYKISKSWGSSIMMVVSNIMLHICKLLRERVDFKSAQEKKMYNHVW